MYELLDRPDLEHPVLVLALEGWIDAGLAANTAGTVLLDELDTVTVARFNSDVLLDYRARRPTVHMVNGVLRRLSWPSTELLAAHDQAGNELLLLTGSEPDRSWHSFVDAVVHLALDFDVRMCVGLGAYPAPAPHTRPGRLAASASTAQLAETGGFIKASLDYPGGVQSAIEQACDRQDIPSMALWAQVPHYAATMQYPAASIALLEGLGQVADLALPLGELTDHANATRQRLDELIEQNPEHKAMLHQLEAAYERVETNSLPDGPLPSGDELAAELERFLRDQRDE
jgi:predicted ATP-grasp superfamily ATP-dependent carboligase